MHEKTLARRCQKSLEQGLALLREVKTTREASAACRIPRETLRRKRVKPPAPAKQKAPGGRKPDLSPGEEGLVVDLIRFCADRGAPCDAEGAKDAVESPASNTPEERKAKLSFKDGRPGTGFLAAFKKRHKGKIDFKKADKQMRNRQICICFCQISPASVFKKFIAIARKLPDTEFGALLTRINAGRLVESCFWAIWGEIGESFDIAFLKARFECLVGDIF